mmetsp:Transcript_26072/g.42613  ORF Transcript_26072/g.42613 Transcript_26072/m.42613 type:complete len:181 (+) Transcript_26072:59-601(+)
MAITMFQLITGLTGFVGCIVCMSMVRSAIAIAACITAMGVTQDTDEPCMDSRETKSMQIETVCLFVLYCIHLTSNFVFGKLTTGDLYRSLKGDAIDWILNVTEYVMAIHISTYLRLLHKCIERNAAATPQQYIYSPKLVYNLFVCWIVFDTFLLLFKVLVTFILYTKYQTKGYQKKYVIN